MHTYKYRKSIMVQWINAGGTETKTEKDGLEVATRVSVQLQQTDPAVKSKDRIVKKTETTGLYDAFDIGAIWLERALAAK